MIIVLPLLLAQVFTNDLSTPQELGSVQAAAFGVIEGKVYQKNYMGDYRTLGWTEVTITSLDGSYSTIDNTDGDGEYSITVPVGEYNVSVWAPDNSDPNYYWFSSAIVAVHTGTAVMNFYLDEPIPEFSDYAISAIITVSLLSSILLAKRMKRQDILLSVK